jgi:aminoglycoside 6'-N-acetyltransferase I
MEIEKISSENLNDLMNLVLELWEDCSFDEEFENYTSIIESEKETCYLVKEQGKFIAFIHLSIRNDYVEGSNDLPVAYIEAIYVSPNYQKQGTARMLINVAENWAIQKGLSQIASDTSLDNESSIEFHKKVGFTEVERVVCFIKDIQRDTFIK